MESSLRTVPTATSVRAVPAKLLIDNRIVINNHLARTRGGKVSLHPPDRLRHRQGAQVDAGDEQRLRRGRRQAGLVTPAHVNLGLAIDLAKPDGTRQLLVPASRPPRRWTSPVLAAYEDIVRKARDGKLTVDDFAGTTISLTNPGTIGTVHSVPRLMPARARSSASGRWSTPPSGRAPARRRSPQRRQQGHHPDLDLRPPHHPGRPVRRLPARHSPTAARRRRLLRRDLHSLRIPYEPIRWAHRHRTPHDDDLDKTARVQELIHAYRVRGHLMADIDPLEYHQRSHPDLDVAVPRPDAVGPRPRVRHRRLRRQAAS
jgi:2-oxoglutarate decarboxylase